MLPLRPAVRLWMPDGPSSAMTAACEREYAYDRQTSFGRLDKALDEAKRRGWTIVDMKHDWKAVFP
jgi:hypothetical protein